jgi:hypothetical protein
MVRPGIWNHGLRREYSGTPVLFVTAGGVTRCGQASCPLLEPQKAHQPFVALRTLFLEVPAYGKPAQRDRRR